LLSTKGKIEMKVTIKHLLFCLLLAVRMRGRTDAKIDVSTVDSETGIENALIFNFWPLILQIRVLKPAL
jgi:hypothetical protein